MNSMNINIPKLRIYKSLSIQSVKALYKIPNLEKFTQANDTPKETAANH
jgi:hypothetical protein